MTDAGKSGVVQSSSGAPGGREEGASYTVTWDLHSKDSMVLKYALKNGKVFVEESGAMLSPDCSCTDKPRVIQVQGSAKKGGVEQSAAPGSELIIDGKQYRLGSGGKLEPVQY